MILIQKIGSLLWRCWFVLVAIFSTFFVGIFLVLPFTFNPKHFRIAYYFERLWAKIIFFGAGLTLKRHDFKELKNYHPYVIISNHTSLMDIMLMLIINREPMVFVGKKELLSLPVFGFIFKRMNITVDRSDAASRIQVFRDAKKAVALKKSICIFPEGGVPNEDIVLKEFLDGPFAIAVMHQIPIVVVTICGMKQILPYAYFRGHPGKVDVYLNDIIDTKGLGRKDIVSIKKECYKLIYNSLRH